MFQNLYGNHNNSELGGANRHQSFVDPAWPPVWCGRQGRAIVANQASTWGSSGWEHSMLQWKHYPTGQCMSAVFRRPDTVMANAAQSRARTPGTSSTGPETTKGTAGVGVFAAEEWIEKVFEV